MARPSFFSLVIALVYILVILSSNHWDPMVFIRVGGHFDPRIGGQEMGYDGQFGYQIALDPLNAWKYTDIAPYRYQRILYPIVVRVLALGQAAAIPWMMLLVKFGSICGGSIFIGANFAMLQAAHPVCACLWSLHRHPDVPPVGPE